MPLLLKYVLPFLLQELVKSGVISALEASTITDVEGFVEWAKSLKTYQEYPVQRDGAFPKPSPSVQSWKETDDVTP